MMPRWFMLILAAYVAVVSVAISERALASSSPPRESSVSEKKAAEKNRPSRAPQKKPPSIPALNPSAAAFPSSVSVSIGKATLLKLSQPIKRVAIGDPTVANYLVLTSTEVYVLGKSLGSTNILVWESSGASREISVEVVVDLEPLKQSLAANLPKEKDIRLMLSSGAIILNGTVADTLSADAAVSLTEAFARGLNRRVSNSGPDQKTDLGASDVKVINLMSIRDSQQVMLEVRIAEVSKNLLEKLGFRFSALSAVQNAAAFIQVPGQVTNTEAFLVGPTGTPVYNTTTSSVFPPLSTLPSSTTTSQTLASVPFTDYAKSLTQTTGAPTFVADPSAPVTSYPNKVLKVDPAAGAIEYLLSGRKGQLLNIDAQKTDELVKILAEPTIVAMSGKPGSFLSGGSIYVPLPVNAGESSKVQLVEFGIRLNFTPIVLDDGRINLQVNPEVSELLGTNPLVLGNRKVSSTVQMRDRETLVIGGLLKNNVKENIKALPILGEIPILGALFRSSEFINDKSELVIVVSPSLVKASAERPKLPTDNFVPPTRSEFFFGGMLEGAAPAEGAAPDDISERK